ncbi:hypothetical protein J7M00_04860 [bacterium]|nr:hypothetical protein [bacterium]
MSFKWEININFKMYVESVRRLEKNDRNIRSRLQVVGQKIREFCEQNYPPDDKRFGAHIKGNVYKFRISGPQVGKSGGYRLIYAIFWEKFLIVPIYVYSKAHKTDLSKKEYNKILEEFRNFLNNI